MVRRYQTASLGALLCGETSCQAESSSAGDSPWGTSPTWRRQSPAGSSVRVSRVCSVVSALGERFLSSRLGVKDCAVRVAERRSEELTVRPRTKEKTRTRMHEG